MQKEKRAQRMRWLGSITSSVGMNVSKPGEIMKNREARYVAVHGVAKKQT